MSIYDKAPRFYESKTNGTSTILTIKKIVLTYPVFFLDLKACNTIFNALLEFYETIKWPFEWIKTVLSC